MTTSTYEYYGRPHGYFSWGSGYGGSHGGGRGWEGHGGEWHDRSGGHTTAAGTFIAFLLERQNVTYQA